MIQGLTPGPLLFTKHVDIIYGIFIAMILTNVVVFAIGKFGIKGAALTSRIPTEILFPVVFVLCAFGSYAVNTNVFDVWVMIIIGGFGYFMVRFGLPPAPFVIAFLLSPLFENGLRRALIMSSGDVSVFVTHPISLAFLLLTLLTIVLLTRSKMKERLIAEE
jgi:putative tricarboxylic transport membrane protein